MGLALVQTASSTFGVAASTTCAATFAAPPTNGNLLVAICMLYDGNGAPSAATGWTLRDSAHNVAGVCYAALFSKYAGAGESATQNPDANGRQLWSCSIYEVSGASGVWATDFVASHLNALAGGTAAGGTTTGTVTGFNTTDPNSLVLGSFSCWSGTANAPINDTGVTPAVTDQTTATGANAGVFGTFSTVNSATFGAIAGGGTAIGGTFTVANASFALQYGIVELQPTNTNASASGALGSALTLSAMTGTGAGTSVGVASGALGSPLTITPMTGFAVANAKEKASKVVGYAATGPADASIAAAKVVAGALTGPPDTRQAAVKVVAYAVLGPPPPRRQTAVRVIVRR